MRLNGVRSQWQTCLRINLNSFWEVHFNKLSESHILERKSSIFFSTFVNIELKQYLFGLQKLLAFRFLRPEPIRNHWIKINSVVDWARKLKKNQIFNKSKSKGSINDVSFNWFQGISSISSLYQHGQHKIAKHFCLIHKKVSNKGKDGENYYILYIMNLYQKSPFQCKKKSEQKQDRHDVWSTKAKWNSKI